MLMLCYFCMRIDKSVEKKITEQFVSFDRKMNTIVLGITTMPPAIH